MLLGNWSPVLIAKDGDGIVDTGKSTLSGSWSPSGRLISCWGAGHPCLSLDGDRIVEKLLGPLCWGTGHPRDG